MPHEATEISGTDPVPDRSQIDLTSQAEITAPTAEDAAEVHALIAACPPLDTNSLYANLIQCTHFSAACAVARIDGKVMGWVSGHRPPAAEATYFLWQVAVHPDARGRGLARQMIGDIFSRAEQGGIRQLQTSITRANDVSWALFRSLATSLSAPMRDEPWFDRHRHFGGQHATEYLVTIGPLAAQVRVG